MVLQNLAGMEMARAFGLDPRTGLMVGSISPDGRRGHHLAWSDHFVHNLGIAQAQELGLAANMIGLIAACTIGGPVASLLMRRHRLQASGDSALEIGTLHRDEQHARLDYYGLLLALLWLNFALMLGYGINALVARTAVTLPAFVGCLLAGILPAHGGRLDEAKWARTFMELAEHAARHRPGFRHVIWACFDHGADGTPGSGELQPVLAFITAAMLVQIALVIAFVLLIVFGQWARITAAVVRGFRRYCAGIYRTAIANMTAVTRAWCGTRGVSLWCPWYVGSSSIW